MTQVWEYIKIALMNIRSNKGRSILTMLGIIIGISSVIMIISIGNGVKSGINGELNSMAGGQIAVYSNDTAENGTEVVFTEEDMDAILEKVPNVKAVTPSWSFSGSATGRKGTFDATATFGKAGLEYSSQDPIIKGRYFTDSEAPLLMIAFFSVGLIFLSGVSYPMELMPWYWQWIHYMVPAAPGTLAFVKINSMGASMSEISQQYIIVWIQCAIYFVLACRAYRYNIKKAKCERQ